MNDYFTGFDMGWEGQCCPDEEGLKALGVQDQAGFFMGWECGVQIARAQIEEANS